MPLAVWLREKGGIEKGEWPTALRPHPIPHFSKIFNHFSKNSAQKSAKMAKYSKGLSAGPESATFEGEEEEEGAAMNGKNEGGGMGKAENEEKMEIIASIFPLGGKPFSALNRQLVPKYFEQPQELFDEFGFRLPDSDGTSDPTAELPPLENSSHRMRWLAMVQSTHSQVEEELIWGKVDVQRLRAAAKFVDMLHEEGIPHSLRPFLWPRLCGAVEKRAKSSLSYSRILRKVERESAPAVDVQIEKDLLRTLPSHYSFGRSHSPGIAPLRRLLRSLAFIFPELGYCQGMGIVVGSLLLVCGEENTFWTMCCLIEDILPPSYYSPSLIGVRADERLLRHLVQVHMPELTEMMAEQSADTTMVFINWLITLLASAFPARILFRIWDWLFAFGPSVIFRLILAMLKLNEEKLLERRASANGPASGTDLFSAITRIPGEIGRVEALLEMAQSFEYSITDHLVSELRRKYQGIVMTETGLMDAQLKEGSAKQKVTRRKLHRSKSIVQKIFQQQMDKREREEEEDPRTKNIRQTELIMDLRNAILQICAHFAECKESQHRERRICTQADYSAGFDPSKEREEFFKGRREGQKRARALTDFEQKDEDDLGFRKNDLITIVSDEQDEHCWVGELDGRRGWFPAKFVQIIDERGKDYCARGDEAVCPRIAELARGPLAFAFRQILCHGIRSSDRQLGILPSSAPPHPWPFIESLAKSLGPTDPRQKRAAATENSKLTLCSTFRLDQDGRVLGPEELLHLAVRTINRSHVPVNAPVDGKFRSLLTFGLNQQCLHLWFDIFCHAAGQESHRKRHYHSWSFIRSPASQQIKCELKLLAQFGFSLDVDSEIVCAEELKTVAQRGGGLLKGEGEMEKGGGRDEWERKGPLKEGVQDMLIKHHLFSWDL